MQDTLSWFVWRQHVLVVVLSCTAHDWEAVITYGEDSDTTVRIDYECLPWARIGVMALKSKICYPWFLRTINISVTSHVLTDLTFVIFFWKCTQYLIQPLDKGCPLKKWFGRYGGFLPAVRYNGHIRLCELKVYSVMTWHTYITKWLPQ